MNPNAHPIRHDLFGFTSTPFLQPPKKPFLDDPRRECLDHLHAFLRFRGFAAIAGRPGVGKTALLRYFTETLHQPSHKIVYLPFAHLSENDLLKTLCSRLETQPPFRKSAVIDAIHVRLREIHPIHPLLVLDEMQNASNRALDAIRLLANEQFDTACPFSCVLIGTAEFFDQLRFAIHESLRQRITYFCHLHELSPHSTGEYLKHCLREVGAEQPIFAPAAIQLIADASRGSIRLITQLAATALIIASDAEAVEVTLLHARQATQQAILPQRESTP